VLLLLSGITAVPDYSESILGQQMVSENTCGQQCLYLISAIVLPRVIRPILSI
jgi:hypothetical protein